MPNQRNADRLKQKGTKSLAAWDFKTKDGPKEVPMAAFDNIPRQTKIMGQPHMLSYINPQEEAMLQKMRGGMPPVAGPGGVPAFWSWSDVFGGGSTTADTSSEDDKDEPGFFESGGALETWFDTNVYDFDGDQSGAAVSNDTDNSYTVSSGNTLSQIAEDNDMSVAEIMAANPDITNPDQIGVGQTLDLSGAGSGSDTYADGVGLGGIGSEPDDDPVVTTTPTFTSGGLEIRSLDSGTQYYVDEAGQFVGLVPETTTTTSTGYDDLDGALTNIPVTTTDSSTEFMMDDAVEQFYNQEDDTDYSLTSGDSRDDLSFDLTDPSEPLVTGNGVNFTGQYEGVTYVDGYPKTDQAVSSGTGLTDEEIVMSQPVNINTENLNDFVILTQDVTSGGQITPVALGETTTSAGGSQVALPAGVGSVVGQDGIRLIDEATGEVIGYLPNEEPQVTGGPLKINIYHPDTQKLIDNANSILTSQINSGRFFSVGEGIKIADADRDFELGDTSLGDRNEGDLGVKFGNYELPDGVTVTITTPEQYDALVNQYGSEALEEAIVKTDSSVVGGYDEAGLNVGGDVGATDRADNSVAGGIDDAVNEGMSAFDNLSSQESETDSSVVGGYDEAGLNAFDAIPATATEVDTGTTEEPEIQINSPDLPVYTITSPDGEILTFTDVDEYEKVVRSIIDGTYGETGDGDVEIIFNEDGSAGTGDGSEFDNTQGAIDGAIDGTGTGTGEDGSGDGEGSGSGVGDGEGSGEGEGLGTGTGTGTGTGDGDGDDFEPEVIDPVDSYRVDNQFAVRDLVDDFNRRRKSGMGYGLPEYMRRYMSGQVIDELVRRVVLSDGSEFYVTPDGRYLDPKEFIGTAVVGDPTQMKIGEEQYQTGYTTTNLRTGEVTSYDKDGNPVAV